MAFYEQFKALLDKLNKTSRLSDFVRFFSRKDAKTQRKPLYLK